ncbi:MAG TPA: transcriptional regulator [Bacteroidales bacterium]|nr:transcriptional regulator [Bacteroidales bacterium]
MSEKNLKIFGAAENCPVRNVVDRIGDKWSVLVLMVLEEGEVLRFNEICGYINTISQKMLTVTLKTLEADGLVKRTVYPQIPPKVEYQLTPRGKTLLPHLHGLVNWAQNNMIDIKESREIFESAINKN